MDIDLKELRRRVESKASNGKVGAVIFTMFSEEVIALLDRLERAEAPRKATADHVLAAVMAFSQAGKRGMDLYGAMTEAVEAAFAASKKED